MEKKASYHTRQSEAMLRYLQQNAGRHITANEICAYFQQQGAPLAKATVYRHLERLVQQGVVAKYIVDEKSSACFEYTGAPQAEPNTCFHCKCERCGKLIHMHCREAAQIERHIRECHGFAVDSTRTVFYGICADCQAMEADKKGTIL